eukprot:6219397-Pyramimonas_sp.AAC.1
MLSGRNGPPVTPNVLRGAPGSLLACPPACLFPACLVRVTEYGTGKKRMGNARHYTNQFSGALKLDTATSPDRREQAGVICETEKNKAKDANGAHNVGSRVVRLGSVGALLGASRNFLWAS